MSRLMLSNELWSTLEKILLQQAIYHKPDLRVTVEGMLYRMCVGCPSRALLRTFGDWNSVYKNRSLLTDSCLSRKAGGDPNRPLTTGNQRPKAASDDDSVMSFTSRYVE